MLTRETVAPLILSRKSKKVPGLGFAEPPILKTGTLTWQDQPNYVATPVSSASSTPASGASS
ncbi:MAG TPA: hypothetical protein VFA48_08315, partial [Gammaproteobacteria bacterium]|nr:hypothetical protein [Gammaproteobacteria bacterium]